MTERALAEETLHRGQSLLRMAGRLSRMGAWSVDLPSLALTLSDEARSIQEMPPDFTPTVEQATDYYAPESRETIARAFEDCVREGTPFDLELQVITPTGRRVWVRSMGEAERDAAGVIQRVQGAIQDISDRKAGEEEIRRLAERLTTTLESITDGFLTIDRDWNFTFLNGEAERLMGRTRAELIGRDVWTEFPEAVGSVFDRELRRALASNETVTFEEFYPPLDRWISVRAYPSEQGLAVYFRDVSESRGAESALRSSNEKFDQLARNVSDAFWIRSPDMRELHYISPAFERIWGRPMESLLADPQAWADFVVPEDRERATSAFASLTKDAASIDLEYRIARPDGEIRWVRARGFQVRDAAGTLIRLTGIVSDITERRLAEAALQESEGRYRTLVEWSPEAIAVARDGRLVFVNPTGVKMWGAASAQDLIGRPILDLVHPDFRQVVWDRLEANRKDGGVLPMIEERLVKLDGTAFDVQIQGNAIVYNGEPALYASIRDITAQKRAAEALRTSMEEFRTLAEAMPQMVWITRPDGWNVYFNPQWMDYTGLSLEESLGHGWIKPFHPDDRDRTWDAWQLATATVGTYSVECRLRRADGVYRWWLIRGVPVRDAAGAILKWFGTCTDIHDLKVAELAISASEERFAKIFHSGLVAIGMAGISSGRLVDVNERWTEFFGYTRDEVIGRTVLELELWANSADRERVIAGVARGSSTWRGEADFRRKSGEIRHAMVSVEAMALAGIAEPLDIVVLVDITERRQLEAQLLQAQKMEAVGRLAGGVAHDFNNTLGVILGYTELLMRQAGPEHQGKLAQILKATQRASGLTRQLLAFSRKQIVDPKVLDLQALVGDLQKMLGRLIGEHIRLTIVSEAALGQVKADPGQLEQVVMNLCVNARDAMPDGGALRIETANTELDGRPGTAQEPTVAGRYVMLAVSDTGSGIDPETLTKIFEPFFTTKEEGKGTGLGLAMVYGIVKQAGGYVWAYSEVGRGTTFKIYLPRIDDDDRPAAPDAAETPALARGWETILLVEDEESLRAIAGEILTEHGYRVIEAAGPADAVQIARRAEPIHLLLTDVVMPGMNGRALAESLVALRPGLRVLYMSGYTDDVIAHSGVLESGTLLLEKPFTALALLRRVREALGDRDRAASASSLKAPR